MHIVIDNKDEIVFHFLTVLSSGMFHLPTDTHLEDEPQIKVRYFRVECVDGGKPSEGKEKVLDFDTDNHPYLSPS